MLYKKDFKAIAEIIKDNTDEICDDNHSHFMILPRNRVAFELADYLATQNPRFDRQKFLNACGL